METDEEKEFEYKFIREFKKLNEIFSEIEKNKKNSRRRNNIKLYNKQKESI